MTTLSEHPIVLLCVAIASYPVYRGLALAIFGSREGVLAARRYLATPDTWLLLRNPFAENWNLSFRLFFFAVLCIAFVAAITHLCARFLLGA